MKKLKKMSLPELLRYCEKVRDELARRGLAEEKATLNEWLEYCSRPFVSVHGPFKGAKEPVTYFFDDERDVDWFIHDILKNVDDFGFCTVKQADAMYEVLTGISTLTTAVVIAKNYGWPDIRKADIKKEIDKNGTIFVTLPAPKEVEV